MNDPGAPRQGGGPEGRNTGSGAAGDDTAARARRINEERFTATARSYASSGVAVRREENEALLRLAAPAPADLALDVGCGPGAVLAALAPFVRTAIGVDLTAAMLEQARARLRDLAPSKPAGAVALVRGAAERLPFRDGVFSLAVTTSTLHHFGDPRAVVREMARVVGAAGRVIIADLVGADDDRARALQNEIERLRDPAHIEMQSRRGIESLLASQGLAVTGRAEGSNGRELTEWLRLAHTPPDRAAMVRERLLGTLADDRAGMGVSLTGETVRFVHHWAIVSARKS
ncbi:MAG TPA: class I SAM-dependent methyltransferase [bacterium]|nr:class I SAM-dependent methyltransferase [bacterium]